jgi:predicted dehydrogenase
VPRAALIGLGGVAERIHLPALRRLPSIELVGACEPDPARRERVGRQFGLVTLHADAATLLAAVKPDIAIVGTPPDTHRSVVLLALRHGAHVFCEKPFMATTAEADEVIDAADRAGRLVAINNQYRYMAFYRETGERIARGEFGDPYLVSCWEQMFHPPSYEKNWRAQLVRSTLFEFGTHALDLICYFFGRLPTSITAHMPRPRPEIAADVVVVATLTFPGERVASLVLNRISHAPERYFEMRVDCRDASIRISLGGVARLGLSWSKPIRRPLLRYSLVRGGEAIIERGGRAAVLARESRPAFASATAAKLAAFVGRMAETTLDNREARYARELIRIVEAGYESARLGQTVMLNADTPVA